MLVDELIEIAGGSHVSTDPALIVGYCTDWTGHLGGLALAVVRPADASEVAAVLSASVRHGVAVIPQGGNTGLVQGGVPDRDHHNVAPGPSQRRSALSAAALPRRSQG